jgi:hypothetical protein
MPEQAKLTRCHCLLQVRNHGTAAFEKTAAWLKGLGAVEVLPDEGSLRVGSSQQALLVPPRAGGCTHRCMICLPQLQP